MTLIPITAIPEGLALAGGTEPPDAAIAAALADLPDNAPVVIMVHGKGYRPGQFDRDPHNLLFAPRGGHGNSRNISWPRRLGFALPGPRDPLGLCIAFGWEASGRIWAATAKADAASGPLAALIALIRRFAPGRRVDLIGHSLGARVILGAVAQAEAGSVGRAILLAGADFTGRARQVLDTPAGRAAEFFNVTSRENDLFDFLFERALSPLGREAALGRGLGGAENWLDIQIDHAATVQGLRAMGLPLAAPPLRICHFSVYLRPGVFRLYRRLVHDREGLTMAQLRAALPLTPDPRWSRFPRLLPRRWPGATAFGKRA